MPAHVKYCLLVIYHFFIAKKTDTCDKAIGPPYLHVCHLYFPQMTILSDLKKMTLDLATVMRKSSLITGRTRSSGGARSPEGEENLLRSGVSSDADYFLSRQPFFKCPLASWPTSKNIRKQFKQLQNWWHVMRDGVQMWQRSQSVHLTELKCCFHEGTTHTAHARQASDVRTDMQQWKGNRLRKQAEETGVVYMCDFIEGKMQPGQTSKWCTHPADSSSNKKAINSLLSSCVFFVRIAVHTWKCHSALTLQFTDQMFCDRFVLRSETTEVLQHLCFWGMTEGWWEALLQFSGNQLLYHTFLIFIKRTWFCFLNQSHHYLQETFKYSSLVLEGLWQHSCVS